MSALHRAAYDADLDEVRRFLAGGAPPDETDEKGFTPLMWSCLRGAVGDQSPVIRALLQAGADPNATTPDGEQSCLSWAVASGNRAAIATLVAGGADIDGRAEQVTPLMLAAQDGDEDLVLHLLSLGADPGRKCGRFTAADYARTYGHTALADRLENALRPGET